MSKLCLKSSTKTYSLIYTELTMTKNPCGFFPFISSSLCISDTVHSVGVCTENRGGKHKQRAETWFAFGLDEYPFVCFWSIYLQLCEESGIKRIRESLPWSDITLWQERFVGGSINNLAHFCFFVGCFFSPLNHTATIQTVFFVSPKETKRARWKAIII